MGGNPVGCGVGTEVRVQQASPRCELGPWLDPRGLALQDRQGRTGTLTDSTECLSTGPQGVSVRSDLRRDLSLETVELRLDTG